MLAVANCVLSNFRSNQLSVTIMHSIQADEVLDIFVPNGRQFCSSGGKNRPNIRCCEHIIMSLGLENI